VVRWEGGEIYGVDKIRVDFDHRSVSFFVPTWAIIQFRVQRVRVATFRNHGQTTDRQQIRISGTDPGKYMITRARQGVGEEGTGGV